MDPCSVSRYLFFKQGLDIDIQDASQRLQLKIGNDPLPCFNPTDGILIHAKAFYL